MKFPQDWAQVVRSTYREHLRVRYVFWEANMRCPRCDKASLVEIRMQIKERDVTFRRCGRCEAKYWESTEGELKLASVLDLARV